MTRLGQFVLAALMLWMGGCASRGNVELLESQLRQQEDQLYAARTQIDQTESDLRVARREVETLQVQLANTGKSNLLPEQTHSLARVTGVRVNKLLSGGLDRDEEPGDDMLNIVLAPHDEQGEAVKLPGTVEVEVVDPAAPMSSRRLGLWKFSSDEVAEYWQSGLSAGYQFRMPWHRKPGSENVTLHVRFVTTDGRQFGNSADIRVTPGETNIANGNRQEVVRVPEIAPAENADFPTRGIRNTEVEFDKPRDRDETNVSIEQEFFPVRERATSDNMPRQSFLPPNPVEANPFENPDAKPVMKTARRDSLSNKVKNALPEPASLPQRDSSISSGAQWQPLPDGFGNQSTNRPPR